MSYSSNFKINTEIVKLEPSSLLEFYILDTSTIIKDPYYDFEAIKYCFHPYFIRKEDSNAELEDEKKRLALVWQGINYYYFPIVADQFAQNGDGSLPRPSLKISNIYPNIKDLLLNLGDLVGAKVTRKRVFKKFLDGFPDADSNAGLPDEVYTIGRKKLETKLYVDFELFTIIESNNIKIPRRQILQNFCHWKYREDGCEWHRAKIVDLNNVEYGSADNEQFDQNLPDPVPWEIDKVFGAGVVTYIPINGARHYFLCKQTHTSTYINKFSKSLWVADECQKTLKACKIRWENQNNPNEILPFGGFPSASRF